MLYRVFICLLLLLFFLTHHSDAHKRHVRNNYRCPGKTPGRQYPSFRMVISNKNAKTICILVIRVATAADSHCCSPSFVKNCPKKPKRPRHKNTKSRERCTRMVWVNLRIGWWVAENFEENAQPRLKRLAVNIIISLLSIWIFGGYNDSSKFSVRYHYLWTSWYYYYVSAKITTIDDLNTKHDYTETKDMRELSLRAHKTTSLERVMMLKNLTIFF